jgi:hypothetical protein
MGDKKWWKINVCEGDRSYYTQSDGRGWEQPFRWKSRGRASS